MFQKQSFITVSAAALGLMALVLLGVSHYGGNVSGLLHMDVPFGETHQVPPGVVLYQDAAYDGMLYYQIMRDLPALFSGGEPSLDSPYRFQRILLPLVTYAVTFGHEAWFSFAMLVINLLVSLASLALMLRMTKGKTLHALTVVVNPAILVGILYMLTEPLSLFLIVLFFWYWERNQRQLNVATLLCLLLSLLARETTVFLIGLLFVWELWHKHWKQALLLVVPMILFTLWQWFLTMRLGGVPFQANSNVVSFPLHGPLQLLQWLTEGLTTYRLSGFALLVFVLAGCGVLSAEWMEKRLKIGLFAFLLTGLLVTMLSMHSHMWGAITSIGRVVTPVYPVFALYAAERDGKWQRFLSILLMIISIVAAIGIASVPHPYEIS